MKVRDVGKKEVYCAKPTASLSEVVNMMKRYNVGVIPVCDGDKFLGVITDRDIAVSCVAGSMDARFCPARDFITSHPVKVSPDTDLEEAARIIGKEQIQRLPILEGERLVGMVSLADVAIALAAKDNNPG